MFGGRDKSAVDFQTPYCEDHSIVGGQERRAVDLQRKVVNDDKKTATDA